MKASLDKVTGLRRAMAIPFCFLLSFINPILLVIFYESAKEKTRMMAKQMDKNVTIQMKEEKLFKSQYVSFMKIELGMIILLF